MSLINTLETPGEFDAAASLRPDEPYFLLLGRDRFAPPLIYQWADKNRRRALAEFDEGRISKAKRDDELRKSTEAETIAEGMVEYKNGWQSEVEEPHRQEALPSGHQLPPEQIYRDRLQRVRLRTVGVLNNAIAELTEAAGEFRDLGQNDEADCLSAKVANMGRLRDLIRPPRPVINR